LKKFLRLPKVSFGESKGSFKGLEDQVWEGERIEKNSSLENLGTTKDRWRAQAVEDAIVSGPVV